MATRFYFPASTAADVSPAFGASWGSTASALRRKMVTTKGSSAITTGSTINVTAPGSLDRQYVSEPLAAQTISGATLASGVLMMREFALSDDVDVVVCAVRLVSNDGSTVRAELYGWNAYGTYLTEFINNATCRCCMLFASGVFDVATYGSTAGDVTVTAGDRLVIEIGAQNSSGVGTTPQFASKWGENATDLTVDDETQTTDGAGWFELSQTLTFSGTTHAGAASMNVVTTMAANGVRQAQGAAAMNSTVTMAVDGNKIARSGASMNVVLTQASAGNLIVRSGADMNASVTVSSDGVRQAQGEADMNVVLTEVAAGIRVANGGSDMNATVTMAADGNRQAQGAVGMNVVVTVVSDGRIPPPPMVRVRAYVKASRQPVVSVLGSRQPVILSRGSAQPTVNTEGSNQPVGVVRASN